MNEDDILNPFTAETARSLYRSLDEQLNERAEAFLEMALETVRAAARHTTFVVFTVPNKLQGSPDNLDKRDVAQVLAKKLQAEPYKFRTTTNKYGQITINW